MTNRASGLCDQATTKQPAVDSPMANAQSRSSDMSKRSDWDERERRKADGGLGIGAPLTAAFIGGFLIIENLAGADQPEEGGLAILPDDMPLFDGEREALADDLSEPRQSEETADGNAEEALRPGDPAAAPSEEISAEVGVAGINPAPALPMAEAATEGTQMPEEEGGEGADANLNFFNINIGNGEADAGIDPFVDDEVISRNREVGTPGDDLLTGTDGHDAISGAEGNDVIQGLGGSDILNGNGGDDQLFGGAGRDRLDGGAGADLLDGGNDDDLDLLKGGSGDDVIILHGQHDVALESYNSGGTGGDDLVIVRQSLADDLPVGADGFTFAFAENHGQDLPTGTTGARRLVGDNIENIRLEGTANHDIVADSFDNRLTGNDGSNIIYAGDGDDDVIGGGGSDDLKGGKGDDELFGGTGDDVIEGGLGEDMLYGEAGDDVFVIGLNDGAVDTVFDHEGANRLVLDGVTDQTVEASILGDDLFVTVDDTPVVKVSDYVGNEGSFAGVDFGQGLRSFDTLLTDHDDLEGALNEVEAARAEAEATDLLSAHLHLAEPTITGDPRSDQRLDGTAGDDWLSGFDGKDVLFGHDGNDILEGGDGKDQLRGGAGDDRYLFSKGDRGIDEIRDAEGQNIAELKGYDRAEIEGAMLGDDLAVLANGKVLFTVDDFASNEGAFRGVQAGNRFLETEDLLA